MKKIFAIAVSILFLFIFNSTASAEWSEPEVVDGGGSGDDIGKWANIEIDSDDNVHIVYHDSSADILHYAMKTEDGWDIQGDHISNVVGYISADMSNDSTIHVSYVAEDNGNDVFKYASYWDGAWDKYSVYDPVIGLGKTMDNSIVVDNDGYVHIAMYVDEANSGLYYTTNHPNGGGNFMVADHIGEQVINSGRGNSIGYGEEDDELFIGYNEREWQGTKYHDVAHCLIKGRDVGAWDDHGTVDDNFYVSKGRIVSLAVMDRRPHMVYMQDDKIIYTINDGTKWKKETLKRSSKYLSMYLKSYDEPYIVYFDDSGGDDRGLKLAYKDTDTDEWKYELIDADVGDYTDDGCSPSVAVDSEGTVHVAYYDANSRLLKYTYSDALGTSEIPDLKEDSEARVGNNRFDPSAEESCRIMYNLSKDQDITIKIYSLSGSLIKTVISNEFKEAGRHGEDEWNGKNDFDRDIASGIYYVVIESSNGWKKVNKIAIVKGIGGN